MNIWHARTVSGLSQIFKLIVFSSEKKLNINVVVRREVNTKTSTSGCRPWLKNVACLFSASECCNLLCIDKKRMFPHYYNIKSLLPEFFAFCYFCLYCYFCFVISNRALNFTKDYYDSC